MALAFRHNLSFDLSAFLVCGSDYRPAMLQLIRPRLADTALSPHLTFSVANYVIGTSDLEFTVHSLPTQA